MSSIADSQTLIPLELEIKIRIPSCGFLFIHSCQEIVLQSMIALTSSLAHVPYLALKPNNRVERVGEKEKRVFFNHRRGRVGH